MNKFCTNCGNELNENAMFCVKCGVAINGKAANNVATPINKTKKPGKGLGITSMILGIIACLDSICSLFIFACLLAAGEYFLDVEKFAFGFIFLMVPVTLLIIGGSLGIASISKAKSGFNLTGIILNAVSLVLCILSIVLLNVM